MSKSTASILESLSPFDEKTNDLNVIIDTPKGSRNKYSFDEELKLFKLSGVLPVGNYFPFDFGFIPNTKGGDGDPIDILVLMDEPAFTGCLISARLIGVIEAEQTERDGKTVRNDRFIGVAMNSRIHTDVNSLDDLNEKLVDEIEHFFVSYNEAKGKRFEPLGRFDSQRAIKLIREAMKTPTKKKSNTKSKPKTKRKSA